MSALGMHARLYSLARGSLALLGLAAVVCTVWPTSREVLLQRIMTPAEASEPKAGSEVLARVVQAPTEAVDPFAGLDRASQTETVASQAEPSAEELSVAAFISRRYRVAEEASLRFVSTAYRTGREMSVDPLLIIAVMAVESSFNPVAESSVGALGLMQVIPRWHPEKLVEHGGEQALLDPEINIQVGTLVLQEYMGQFGELERALQKYAGAFHEPTARYSAKVLAEKARLMEHLKRRDREV